MRATRRARWVMLATLSGGFLLAGSCSMVWQVLQLVSAALTFVQAVA